MLCKMSYVFIDRRQSKLTVALVPIEDVRQFRAIYKKVYGLHAYLVPVFVATKRHKVDTEDIADFYYWALVNIKRIMTSKSTLKKSIDPVAEPEAFDKEFVNNETVPSEPTKSEPQMPPDVFEEKLDNEMTKLDGSIVSCNEGTSSWYSFRALTEQWLPAITTMKDDDVYTAIVRLKVRGNCQMTVMTYDELMYLYKHADFFDDVNVLDVVMIPSRKQISPKILSFYGTESVESDEYFLRFTYDIRKLAGTTPRPSHCKNKAAKKIMEYMYNNYEFDADPDATGVAYGDVYDKIALHGSYEKVAEVLGWLGYMVRDGKVKHLRRRAEARDIAIVHDEIDLHDRTGKKLEHKILALKYTNDFRAACEVPFSRKVSAWYVCSL